MLLFFLLGVFVACIVNVIAYRLLVHKWFRSRREEKEEIRLLCEDVCKDREAQYLELVFWYETLFLGRKPSQDIESVEKSVLRRIETLRETIRKQQGLIDDYRAMEENRKYLRQLIKDIVKHRETKKKDYLLSESIAIDDPEEG